MFPGSMTALLPVLRALARLVRDDCWSYPPVPAIENQGARGCERRHLSGKTPKVLRPLSVSPLTTRDLAESPSVRMRVHSSDLPLAAQFASISLGMPSSNKPLRLEFHFEGSPQTGCKAGDCPPSAWAFLRQDCNPQSRRLSSFCKLIYPLVGTLFLPQQPTLPQFHL